MAITAAAQILGNYSYFISSLHCRNPTASHGRKSIIIRACSSPSKPETQNRNKGIGNGNPKFVSQDELSYLVRLGIGSLTGAAAIKYGSIIFPEITRPNIALALFMITAPMIIAVLLLIKPTISSK